MKKILIVQFRTDLSKEHEQQCFLEDLSYMADMVEFVNAIEEEFPADLSSIFAVIFGGSGEFYLSKGDGVHSWLPKAWDFMHRVITEDIPLLGICFGYQVIGMGLGAEVVDDPEMAETGTFPVTKFADIDDELFSSAPEVFDAQLGHKDTLVDFPDTFMPLSKSEKVPVNSFRLRSCPVWGILFHPELNSERMRTRMAMFPEYVEQETSIEKILSLFHDTPESSEVLHRFVNFAMERG